jgi:hypothetical protein
MIPPIGFRRKSGLSDAGAMEEGYKIGVSQKPTVSTEETTYERSRYRA